MRTEDSKIRNKKDFLNSPFRYPGNQVYTLENLLHLIPGHQIFIEPFCGGASEFFAKTKAEENWLNDIDSELIGTYKTIRDQPERLIAFLKKEKVSKERYEYIKTEFVPKNSFDVTARWFYLNRTSCLETMSKFWRYDDKVSLRPLGWNKKILECSEKLQGVKLTSEDFEDVINEVPEGAFLYITPPYSIHHSSAQNKLHKFPFEKEDHLRLADVLKRNTKKIKFMLTYNENEEIKKMYSWDRDLVITNLPNMPPQKGEIVIMNYKKKIEK
jgi:DNA adenine methylase